ncbi:hypothetical protein KC318_g7773 [Hortaea werneckii]|uniref:SRP9 domain-containing protein n=1 Tax=Hortaea werneckii TaxID=91943 RepID=A0A3M6Z5V8_HORWE|nr:hypothetical protein KC334_g1815 [Hortaea werneckii]KAI7006917.1 hypothetical protein KC355_g7537 [Hortaea werneckii]KAI7664340.1 hypothetical protein KC318_g7773 [Hortaea werneckii]RMY10459.1 hypothetical protein D0867_08395 [Hortaea werneckii]RMY27116.1 hypothetical protein D0866_10370 [Hortaea werneckii]
MVYIATIEEWHRQSALLLQARPTTARITTKYKVPNLASPKYQKDKKRKRDDTTDEKEAAAPKTPKAWLVLKTYCPESGVVLKFKTDRQADVGRLINGLGRLGRHMAALPEKTEAPLETATEDVALTESSAAPAQTAADTKAPQQQQQRQAGGGKKKKKGKK